MPTPVAVCVAYKWLTAVPFSIEGLFLVRATMSTHGWVITLPAPCHPHQAATAIFTEGKNPSPLLLGRTSVVQIISQSSMWDWLRLHFI